MNLWVPSVVYPSGKCNIVLIAAHSWGNIPWKFPGRWNVLLARIDYRMHSLSKLFLEETIAWQMQQWPCRYFPVLFAVHCKYIVVIGWTSLLFKITWGIAFFTTTAFLSLVCSNIRPSQRSKYAEGVARRMRRCDAIQRLSRKCVQKKNTQEPVHFLTWTWRNLWVRVRVQYDARRSLYRL